MKAASGVDGKNLFLGLGGSYKGVCFVKKNSLSYICVLCSFLYLRYIINNKKV